jgi:hypothetical protein
MKCTQIRNDKRGNCSFRTLDVEQLLELMKSEDKSNTVLKYREAAPWLGYSTTSSYGEKLSKWVPAAALTFKEGQVDLKCYNGVVMLQLNRLAGIAEAEEVKRLAAEWPQTYLAFIGASGRSVKIWVRFTYPDNGLPSTTEEAERFHAHAYRLAVKCYQPQLPFNIDLLEPTLKQHCLQTYDPSPYFNPDAMPFYLKQPERMPEVSTYLQKPTTNTDHPLQRLAPGYDSHRAIRVLLEAAFARTLEGDKEGDDTTDERYLHTRLIRLAEHCFQAGIPEGDVVHWTHFHPGLPDDDFLIRQTVRNVYSQAEGFGQRSSLLPEQIFALQTEEFMKRRYEFRSNTLTRQVEFRERYSLNFYFRPADKRAMASIALNAHQEGIKLWDKDVSRYLASDRIPLFQPAEEYLFHLPSWDGHDYIADLAARVPCDNAHWAELFRRWFLSMVAHWNRRDKKYANSISPLLVGPQAYRKSTFCRLLLPPELQAY